MTATKKKIVLSGYYGFDNLGDEAILNYLIHFLRENDIDPVVLSSNPYKTSQTFNVESINRTDFSAVLDALKESDGLISGGGSLLQDKTSKKSLLYYLIIMYMAKKIANVPVYFYGQGVGPIAGKDSRFITKHVLKHNDITSVRDLESKELLDTIGLRNEINVIHDPVLFYPMTPLEKSPEGFTEDELEFLNRRPVYVSIRPTESNQPVVDAFYYFIKHLKEKGIPVVSFPFHPSQDTNITKEILSKFDNTLFIEKPLSLEQATFILGKSRLVVGMRLHSLILGASQHTPFVGVSYDPKIDSFVKQFGFEVAGDIFNITVDALVRETELLLGNEEVSRLTIKEHLDRMAQTNKAFNEKIITAINRSQ